MNDTFLVVDGSAHLSQPRFYRVNKKLMHNFILYYLNPSLWRQLVCLEIKRITNYHSDFVMSYFEKQILLFLFLKVKERKIVLFVIFARKQTQTFCFVSQIKVKGKFDGSHKKCS